MHTETLRWGQRRSASPPHVSCETLPARPPPAKCLCSSSNQRKSSKSHRRANEGHLAEHDLQTTTHEFSSLVQVMLPSSVARHVVSIVVTPQPPPPTYTKLRSKYNKLGLKFLELGYLVFLFFSCCVSVGGNGIA